MPEAINCGRPAVAGSLGWSTVRFIGGLEQLGIRILVVVVTAVVMVVVDDGGDGGGDVGGDGGGRGCVPRHG